MLIALWIIFCNMLAIFWGFNYFEITKARTMRETQATPRGDAKACSCRRLAPLTPEKDALQLRVHFSFSLLSQRAAKKRFRSYRRQQA